MVPKPKQKHEENIDSWLMSYADMITLLLCFFIIFVSVSEPKKDKITEIAEGMSGKFGAVQFETTFMSAARAVQTAVEKHELYRDVAIQNKATGLDVELATHRFFTQGGADIDPSAITVLSELLHALKDTTITDYQIIIESHTDDTPPQSGLYKTNWELSAVRAAKIVDEMVKQGFPADHIQAIGYGDARPKVPNLDAEGDPIENNRAINQRLIIKMRE